MSAPLHERDQFGLYDKELTVFRCPAKALELFMISVVTKAAEEAKSRSSKRVTAAHLKQAIEKDEQFDFLAEHVANVPDVPASKKEDSEEPMEGKRKRAAAGGVGGTRRKKKTDDDDL